MTKHHPEDEILAELLQQEAVWQKTYEVYRLPFVDFFTDYHSISRAEAINVLSLSFSELLDKVYAQEIAPPFHYPLFGHLLILGNSFLQSGKEHPLGKQPLPRAMRAAIAYYESDVLVLLIKEDNEKVFTRIYTAYKEPTLLYLRKRFSGTQEDPEETYSEAMEALRSNAKEDKITLPMQSRLMTYFFTVALYRFIAFLKKQPNWNLPEKMPEGDAELPVQEQEDYLDYLLEGQQKVQHLEFKDEGELVHKLLLQLDELYREAIRLRYLEELNYREIAHRLNISEEAARKRVFDGLKKMRQQL